jgi:polyisoprenoid-binding protein YceI
MLKPMLAGVSLLLLAAACSPQPIIEAAPVTVAEAPAAVTPVAITVPAGEYVSDPLHSSITFKTQHLGLGYYTMRFRTFDASVAFDPKNIPASKVSAKIRPSDILVGYPGDYVKNHPGTKFKSWEDDLANSTRFLNAGEFPEISFVSTGVEASGERNAKVTGDLTIGGVTKPVTLDVRFDGETAEHAFAKVPAVGFSATGTFKRSDFNLASHLPAAAVGDEIIVSIEGDFIQKAS